MSTSEWPNIAIIGAIAFLYISKLLGSSNFKLCLYSLDIQTNSASFAEASDLSNVPSKYYKFADVFSKTKAEVLTSHHSYNLQINPEKDAQPPVGPIYSFLVSEQEALKEFIKENLNIDFIQLTFSLHGILVLFIKKKDGSLYLCVDFYSLNYISKKNHYPLSLISNLLNLSHKAQVYSKIDFHHAYHLVHIVTGDEWKTALRIYYRLFE